MRVLRRSAGVAVLLATFSAVAACAHGDPLDVSGRVFNLANFPASGRPQVAVGPGGTVWALDESGRLWQLSPGSVNPVRLATPKDGYRGLAPLPGGALLLTQRGSGSGGRVWRRSADGALKLLAGSTSEDPDPSTLRQTDGGRATQTWICSADAVAALPHGGFVFTDGYGTAVRRVMPDGTITTVYALSPADRAYGCASTTPSTISGLAVTHDGAILLGVDRGTYAELVRVVPGRTPKVLARHLEMPRFAAAPDGSVLFITSSGAVRRLAPGARQSQVVLPGYSESQDPLTQLFGSDGAPARDFYGGVGAVAAAPDGGVVAVREANGSPGHVLYVAPRAPSRLAVALQARTGHATTASYSVSYLSTQRGQAQLLFMNGQGRGVASATSRAHPGVNWIEVRHHFRFGTYQVWLTVTGAGGHRARSRARLLLGATLPQSYARKILVPHEVNVGGGCLNCENDFRPVHADGCRRVSLLGVDCGYSYSYQSLTSARRCVYATARLLSIGVLAVREHEFDCRRGQHFPNWPGPDENYSPSLLPTQP